MANDFDLGKSTSYAYYVSEGGTKTPQEFGEMLVNIDTVASRAEESASDAEESATSANESKESAIGAKDIAIVKANEASASADIAVNKAGEASASATVATNKASEASASATTASAKATESSQNALTAVGAKNDAVSAKNDAVTAKTQAQSAKNDAVSAKLGAESARDEVQSSADQITQNASDIAQLKSEFTALESDGVVPSAEQILTDKGITDSVPYHYRKTGGDGADRLYDQIVGGTVCWNQLVKDGNFSNGNGWTPYMAAATYSNNIATIVTADSVDVNSGGSVYQTGITTLANHKYIVSATIKGDGEHRVALRADGGFIFDTIANISNDFKTFVGVAVGASGYSSGRVVVTAYGPSVTIYLKNVVIFDLTAMFGSTVADYIYNLEIAHTGDGVAFFKSLFPNDYYEYNSGELVSVSGLSEHKMVGFNRWDEEWEVGDIRFADGQKYDSNNYFRSKNYIPIFPSTSYYFASPKLNIYFYDDNKIYLGQYTEGLIRDKGNFAFVTPSKAHFMMFASFESGNNVYNHDICINLSDPAKNGTYEPYKAHSYPLDSTLILRGVPQLVDGKIKWDGDTYDADGTVTRKYGVVDLGTLIWTKSTDYANPIFYAKISDIISGVQDKKLVCTKYDYVVGLYAGTVADYTTPIIGTPDANTQVIVRDPNYDSSDAATFKAAMSGVMLVYRLATSTTEEAEPYQHLQQCDPNGMEEYVSTGIVPVGHNSFYPENLRAKVEQLPWNFASLIAPTEATFTATQNYTTGALFIVNNVLYKATSNIANGGTITPNTNCTATTLAEIISALA